MQANVILKHFPHACTLIVSLPMRLNTFFLNFIVCYSIIQRSRSINGGEGDLAIFNVQGYVHKFHI